MQVGDRSLGLASAAQATADFDKVASYLVANASPPLPAEHRGPVQTAVAALVLKLFKSSGGGWWLGQVMRGCLMGGEGAWQAGQRVCARPEVCSLRTAGFWTGTKDPADNYDHRMTNAPKIKQWRDRLLDVAQPLVSGGQLVARNKSKDAPSLGYLQQLGQPLVDLVVVVLGECRETLGRWGGRARPRASFALPFAAAVRG